MFSLEFAKTYDFPAMANYHLSHPIEDSFATSSNAFCVADGVTRDLKDGTALTYPTTFEQAQKIVNNYPNPSGAAKVAKLCAQHFVQNISQIPQADISLSKINKIVRAINQEIRSINKTQKIDYLQHDYFSCVAAGGIFTDTMLYCFAITDCYIKLVDAHLQTIFDSSSATLSPYDYHPSLYASIRYKDKTSWENNNFRKYYRKNVRNNIWYALLHKYTFGALTGQKSAMAFVKTFALPLDSVQYVLVYSDGCEECLKTSEQLKSVIENPEQISQELHEKTLLIYKKNENQRFSY